MPVTAHDVKFTVDLFARPEVRTSTFNTGLSQIESVEVLDDISALVSLIWNRDLPEPLAYAWISPDDDDMGLVVMLGENSKIGYHNPEVIRLVNAAQEAKDEETLSAIYQELAPIVQQEQPFTFLIFGVEAYVAHRRVKGMSSPFRANALWSAGQLWIEDDLQPQ